MGLKERRQKEKDQRKKQILAAARRILYESGLQAASVTRIAGLAELGVGTLYGYYQNKEEIFIALQQEGLKLLCAKLTDIDHTMAPPVEKLKQYAMAYLDFSRNNREYFDIINYFLASPEVVFPSPLKDRIDSHGNNILQVVAGTIKAGTAAGIFADVDADRYAMILWGTLQGMLQLRKMENTLLKGADYEDLYQASVENFIRGLWVTT
jgi:AcrR family transcriptional regulator